MAEKITVICLYIIGGVRNTCPVFMREAGLQLRNSEQNCFHDNFLISQPNPMM